MAALTQRNRVARELFPINVREQPWDELSYMRHIPNRDDPIRMKEVPNGVWSMRTNALGLREDAEPLAAKPDLRILVTGDSHTDGVCENRDSFPHVLQRALDNLCVHTFLPQLGPQGAPPARAIVSPGQPAPNFTKNQLDHPAFGQVTSRSLADWSGQVIVFFLLGYG